MVGLLNQPYNVQDAEWVVKAYFDRMYDDGRFVEAVSYITRRYGFCIDGAYCNFPDLESLDVEDHFEGVEFSYGYPPGDDEIVVVSEGVCADLLRLSCCAYVERHPEDDLTVNTLLANLMF